MNCKHCNGSCIRDGKQRNGVQRYKCKSCGRKQQRRYIYKALESQTNTRFVCYLKESVSIRGIARLLQISTTTVLKRILGLAEQITPPSIQANEVYEVDEIRTFIGSKKNQLWIAYALKREDRSVVSFAVGPRTNKTLDRVLINLKMPK